MFAGYQQQLAAANYMQQLQRMIAIENLSKQYSGIWSGANAAAATPLVAPVGAGSWPDAQHVLGSLVTSTAATTPAVTRSPVNLTNAKESPKK